MKNILYEERESDKHVASILKVGRGWGGGGNKSSSKKSWQAKKLPKIMEILNGAYTPDVTYKFFS